MTAEAGAIRAATLCDRVRVTFGTYDAAPLPPREARTLPLANLKAVIDMMRTFEGWYCVQESGWRALLAVADSNASNAQAMLQHGLLTRLVSARAMLEAAPPVLQESACTALQLACEVDAAFRTSVGRRGVPLLVSLMQSSSTASVFAAAASAMRWLAQGSIHESPCLDNIDAFMDEHGMQCMLTRFDSFRLSVRFVRLRKFQLLVCNARSLQVLFA